MTPPHSHEHDDAFLGPPPFEVEFMCIGATKCATTWLSEVLRSHPETNHSLTKSPHFFSTADYRKGWDYYKQYWPNQPGIKGESSTSYLYRDCALKRIQQAFPSIRLFVVLRNPFERMVSHLRHKLRTRPSERPEDLLQKGPHLITDGLYARYLPAVFEHFPPDQVKIFFFDEIQTDARLVVRQAYDFLGINQDHQPREASERIGAGFTPRFKRIDRLRVAVHRTLENMHMYRVIRWMKNSRLPSIYRQLNSSRSSDEDIEQAVEPYVEVMINDLEELTDLHQLQNRPQPHQWLRELRIRGEPNE